MFGVLKTTKSGRQMLRTASMTMCSAWVGLVSTNPIGGIPNASGGSITCTLTAIAHFNGDIPVAGTAPASVDGATSFALARFTANGPVNKTFGTGGLVLNTALPNGQIRLAGFTTGTKKDAPGETLLVGHTSNGSLDTRLATGGIAEAVSAAGSPPALAQPSNRFVPGRQRREFSGVLLHWSAAPLECCNPWWRPANNLVLERHLANS
jgi:hypothetical protein